MTKKEKGEIMFWYVKNHSSISKEHRQLEEMLQLFVDTEQEEWDTFINNRLGIKYYFKESISKEPSEEIIEAIKNTPKNGVRLESY
jgi:hypothetical protein